MHKRLLSRGVHGLTCAEISTRRQQLVVPFLLFIRNCPKSAMITFYLDGFSLVVVRKTREDVPNLVPQRSS